MKIRLPLVLAGLLGCPAGETIVESPPADPGASEILYREAAGEFGLGAFASPPPDTPSDFIYTEDRTNGGGAALVDLDADGDLDLLLTAPYGPNALYLWDGEAFDRVPSPSFENLRLTTSVSVADLDGDGLRDLLIGADSQLIGYRNQGGGTFERETVLVDDDELMRVEGAALADVDGDGFVDMYVSIQGRHPLESRPIMGRDRVFLGRGGFDFEEITSRFGSNEDRTGLTFAATWFDVDRDGDLDAYTVKDRGADLIPATLLVNPGSDQAWTSEGPERNLDVPADGMGVVVGDVQGDGDVEVVVSDNAGRVHVRSIRDGVAEDVGPTWGVVNQDVAVHETSWGVALADIDNDADLDLIAAFGRREVAHHLVPMRNNLWEWNAAAGRFRERTDLLAMGITSELEAWRGILPGDIDGDGTLELVFTSHVGPVSVQHSEATRNRWIAIELSGPATNPDALGAEVVVRTNGKEFVQWMGSGVQGVHSATQPRMHVGLGPGLPDVTVDVRWPNGETSTYEDLELDELHLLSP